MCFQIDDKAKRCMRRTVYKLVEDCNPDCLPSPSRSYLSPYYGTEYRVGRIVRRCAGPTRIGREAAHGIYVYPTLQKAVRAWGIEGGYAYLRLAVEPKDWLHTERGGDGAMTYEKVKVLGVAKPRRRK